MVLKKLVGDDPRGSVDLKNDSYGVTCKPMDIKIGVNVHKGPEENRTVNTTLIPILHFIVGHSISVGCL